MKNRKIFVIIIICFLLVVSVLAAFLIFGNKDETHKYVFSGEISNSGDTYEFTIDQSYKKEQMPDESYSYVCRINGDHVVMTKYVYNSTADSGYCYIWEYDITEDEFDNIKKFAQKGKWKKVYKILSVYNKEENRVRGNNT